MPEKRCGTCANWSQPGTVSAVGWCWHEVIGGPAVSDGGSRCNSWSGKVVLPCDQDKDDQAEHDRRGPDQEAADNA